MKNILHVGDPRPLTPEEEEREEFGQQVVKEMMSLIRKKLSTVEDRWGEDDVTSVGHSILCNFLLNFGVAYTDDPGEFLKSISEGSNEAYQLFLKHKKH